jgi:hypothetical protein
VWRGKEEVEGGGREPNFDFECLKGPKKSFLEFSDKINTNSGGNFTLKKKLFLSLQMVKYLFKGKNILLKF